MVFVMVSVLLFVKSGSLVSEVGKLFLDNFFWGVVSVGY